MDSSDEYYTDVDASMSRKMDLLTHSIQGASRSMKSIERLHRDKTLQHSQDLEKVT